MKARTLRLALNLWPPFLFVGTHFGRSLFAMTDPFRMIPMLHCLGPDHIEWDKAGEIEFVKPGRGVLHACFDLDDGVLADIRAATATGEKLLRWFEADVLDAHGSVVARTRKQLHIRRKPGR